MNVKKFVWIIIALIVAGAAFWWTTIKKKVVKDAVTKVVQKKTDSLYKITYDTSEIDELNGNVYLRNVQIRLDSAQWFKLIEKDSIPPVTVALTIDKITIQGLKELKLLSNRSLDVTNIILNKPVFRLDKWARKKPSKEAMNDTAEIYKRLVGNFDFLRAKNIQVIDGRFTIMDQLQKNIFSAGGINISIDDFLVDSAHNYENLLSYFIKQTKASVHDITGSSMKTGKIEYDSKLHFLRVNDIVTTGESPLHCKAIEIDGLSTESFITRSEINARKILLKEPSVNLLPKTGKTTDYGKMLSGGSVDSLMVEKGNVTIRSKKTTPVYVKDVNLLIKNVKSNHGNIVFEEYLNPDALTFSIGSVKLPMGFHIMDLTKISYPGKANELLVAGLKMKPSITRQQLKTVIGKQADMYTISANNLVLDKINLKKIIKTGAVEIEKVSMHMNLHVFDDKTIPLDSAKRESGKFPYEKMTEAKTPIEIHTIEIKNSTIAYEEQAEKSEMNGTVFFTNVNGRLTNITNIPARLAKDNIMRLDASAKVMGVAALQSHWDMPLNSPDAQFKVAGKVAPFPVTVLSPVFEPLSMTTIKSGYADRLDFTINGNHKGSDGTVLLDYHDLKIDLLKKDKNDSLQKKGLLSFIANVAVKNKNTSDKPKAYTMKRDKYKSLFNILWKSVFAGGKNTILITK